MHVTSSSAQQLLWKQTPLVPSADPGSRESRVEVGPPALPVNSQSTTCDGPCGGGCEQTSASPCLLRRLSSCEGVCLWSCLSGKVVRGSLGWWWGGGSSLHNYHFARAFLYLIADSHWAVWIICTCQSSPGDETGEPSHPPHPSPSATGELACPCSLDRNGWVMAMLTAPCTPDDASPSPAWKRCFHHPDEVRGNVFRLIF